MEVYEKIKTDLVIGIIMLLIIQSVYNWSDFGRDSTDGGARSGMELHIDAMTSCHYLSKGKGGLIKRTDRTNNHICQ